MRLSSCSRVSVPSSRRNQARWLYFSDQVLTASRSTCSCTPRWRSPVHTSGSERPSSAWNISGCRSSSATTIPTWLTGLLVIVWIARSASERPRNSQMSPVRAVAIASSRLSTPVPYAEPCARVGSSSDWPAWPASPPPARWSPTSAATRWSTRRRSCASGCTSASATPRPTATAQRRRPATKLTRRAASSRLGAHPLLLDRALELAQRPLDVPAHDRARELLGQPGPDPAAGHAVLQPQLDPRAPALARPQAPAPALVHAGDGRPGQVALRLELDDLDQLADLRRADPHQHPVARAHPGAPGALDLPAGDAGEEVEHAGGVGDLLPHQRARRVDLDVLGDPHPSTGKRRSAASASSVSCIVRSTCA